MSKRLSLLPFTVLLLTSLSFAQSSTATLSGTVQDENGAIIPAAAVTIHNRATSLERHATTNESGSFTIPLLPPGEYTVLVERQGFTRVQLTGIILNVGDQKAVSVQLKVGDVKSEVTVSADASLITTRTDVSTVIDQNTVKNIPLNGRSFQTLFELTPGVQITASSPGSGQFSVNGQRTNSNYITVDGVSAMTGIANVQSASATGSGTAVGFTAQGTTANLVSVDALQEFRIQTSTYAPEFGRGVGGQITLVTKSGTSDYHGTLFEYFRNEFFDATDWFVNANRGAKPPTRQNQFGGTFSGPLPFFTFGDNGGSLFHSGKDRTFFFFSYEGLRLMQPRSSTVQVPSLSVRANAHPLIRPILNSFPVPTSPPNVGGLTAPFFSSWGDHQESDATAIRIDHRITSKMNVFGRFSATPSFSNVRSGAAWTTTNSQDSASLTLGSTWIISGNAANDLRANFARTDGPSKYTPDTFGGAVPFPLDIFAPGTDFSNSTFFLSTVQGAATRGGSVAGNAQRQFNIVDGFTYIAGNHSLKFGADFRRLNPTFHASGFQQIVFDLTNVTNAVANLYQNVVSAPPNQVNFDTLSFYAQDTWKVNRHLSTTFGVRWEFVPPPHIRGDSREAMVLNGLDNILMPNHVSLAPAGTPLFNTRYTNFAPRFGASYLLHDKQGHEMVIRGGVGLFYDLGYGEVSTAYAVSPFTVLLTAANQPLPITVAPPVPGVGRPTQIVAFDPDLKQPRTIQWNLAIEKAFGSHQNLTVSYVGADGKELLKRHPYSINLVEFPPPNARSTVYFTKNGDHSDYRALQVQFQRRLHNNFQSIAAYTFSRSRDTNSGDVFGSLPSEKIPLEAQYGYSDFDIRHLLTASATYQVPKIKAGTLVSAIVNDWGIDGIFRFRSAMPFDIKNQNAVFSDGITGPVMANVIPGVPIWVDDPTTPGGRRLNNTIYTAANNPQLLAAGCLKVARNPGDPTTVPIGPARGAFCSPVVDASGNLIRNSLRGFGARQLDVSLHRSFPFSERARVQLRVDVFNITNTPNFANPLTGLNSTSTTFGRSQQTLATSLGGLNALYQIGGQRSMQFSAKLFF